MLDPADSTGIAPARQGRPRWSPRLSVAVAGGKLAGAVTRALGRGGGTALPGLIAERLAPDIVTRLGWQFGLGAAVVTGTNGKTTTTAMLAAIAGRAGLRTVHNRSGSNLARGLAATLVDRVSLAGRLRHGDETLAVLEVDEATVPFAVRTLAPASVTFVNLFRDQLDRFGEVDTVFARWREAVTGLPPSATVVLNADDPTVAALGEGRERRAVTFGIDDVSCAIEGQEHASDARWCHVCGTEYRYAALYAGHIGDWTCEGCGRGRGSPDVAATSVRLHGLDGARIEMRTPAGPLAVELPLGGLYNVYNALAAAATAFAHRLPPQAILAALGEFRAAFGRQERFEVDGRGVRILLGKNPAGLNQVLRLLASIPGEKSLLVILNDGIADGTDVSWIWDVDYDRLGGQVESVVAAGTRAAEMAVRLKYAGWGHGWPVIRDIAAALHEALRRTPEGGELHVIPTYTAMLEVRELLAAMSGRGHFWEQ